MTLCIHDSPSTPPMSPNIYYELNNCCHEQPSISSLYAWCGARLVWSIGVLTVRRLQVTARSNIKIFLTINKFAERGKRFLWKNVPECGRCNFLLFTLTSSTHQESWGLGRGWKAATQTRCQSLKFSENLTEKGGYRHARAWGFQATWKHAKYAPVKKILYIHQS